MRRKSVAIVLANGIEGRGGIERIMLYMSRQIAADAPDLPLVIQTSRWDWPGPLKHLGMPVALVQFVWRLLRRRVGVAHINVAPRGSTFRKMLFAAAARSTGARTIVHLHGSGYDDFFRRLPGPVARVVGAFFRKADAVVVLGSYWRNFALTTLQVDPSRLIVIENGVAAAQTRAEPTHDVPIIAFMGQLGERKGVDILLTALGILNARGVAFQARLGGNGPVDRFRDLAQENGITDRVDFLGWVDEAAVARTLAEADLFVLPSRAENQPVSILEAMAHGLPVVATRIGAIPEQVVDGVTGSIVPPEDAEALADALERLCLDPNLRQMMGTAGLGRWREYYSIESTARRMIDLYRRLLA